MHKYPVLLVLLLVVCLPGVVLAQEKIPFQEDVPVEFREAPKTGDLASRVKGKFTTWCKVAGECGDLAYITCAPKKEGNAYYVKSETLEIIMRCGAYCIGKTEKSEKTRCGECPPAEWKACEAKNKAE